VKYRVRILNIYRLLLIFILINSLTSGLSIYLSNVELLTKDNPFFFVLLFGGFITGFIYFFYFNPPIKPIELNETTLKINDEIYKWTDFKSYKFKNDSPEFTTILLKTQENKRIRIGHRNKTKKDDFDKFINALGNKINLINRTENYEISIIPSFLDTKYGKYLGYLMILFWILLTIFSIKIGFNIKILANFLIFTGITIGLLIRIFIKRK